MTKYVEFSLEDGGTILIETPDEPARPGSGFVRAGETNSEWADKAQRTFEQSLLGVRSSAEKLVQHLSALGPDEMEMSFRLKATGELGGNLAIAKSGSDANYNVLLKWRKEKDQPKAKDEDKKKSPEENDAKAG